MTAMVLDEYILPALIRYTERYHWRFSISTRIINMYYGTEYTQKELKALYRKSRKYPG